MVNDFLYDKFMVFMKNKYFLTKSFTQYERTEKKKEHIKRISKI